MSSRSPRRPRDASRTAGDATTQAAPPPAVAKAPAVNGTLGGPDDTPEAQARAETIVRDKWRLLPHFLEMRGLMKQVAFARKSASLAKAPSAEPESLRFFCRRLGARRARARARAAHRLVQLLHRDRHPQNRRRGAESRGACSPGKSACWAREERESGRAKNRRRPPRAARGAAAQVRSEADPKFLLKYTDVYVGEPSVEEDSYTWRDVTPFECRLRDCTYSAPIYVNVLYTRGKQVVRSEGVQIGRIPVMLRSSRCVLRHQDAARLAELKECPFDPGGYFVIKGVEKVILMQEQLSKNRVIIELDAKACVCASVTSSTHERKSRCSIFVHQRNRRVYLRHNTLGEDVPITVVLKAMGMESDQEIVQLVGPEPELMDLFAASLEEPCSLNIRTQLQALRHIGNTIRAQQAKTQSSGGGGWGASYRRHAAPEDEAREVLAHVVLSHVPVRKYDFRPKCVYIGYIVRRVLHAVMDAGLLDDKDYYGNKRLELAGQLLSRLFEDLFKRFNADVKKQADLVLSKPNRTAPFDVVKCFRTDTITCAAPRPVRILAPKRGI